jgi:hypothetical protein
MKAEQLRLALEEVKQRENEQLMNILMLMGSVSNNMMSHENEIVEGNENEIDEFEELEPVETKIVRIPKIHMKIKENKVVEVNEDEINEFKDGKHMKHKAKASTKASSKAKSYKVPEYVMDFYLSNLE